MKFNFEYTVSAASADLNSLRLPLVMEDPKDLVLIRHCESEGNVIHDALRKGLLSEELYQKIVNTPNNLLRATPKGELQAKEIGEWWKGNMNIPIHKAITSYYIRAEETAGIFAKAAGLESLKWRKTSLVGERHWGTFQAQEEELRTRGYLERKTNARHWTPPDGESIRSLESHARSYIFRLQRKYGMMGILTVSHGEFINTMGALIERYTDEQLNVAIEKGIPNCGITHYSRVNPKTGEIDAYFNYVRRICVWNPNYAGDNWSGKWAKIVRPEFTSDDLINHARSHIRLLS